MSTLDPTVHVTRSPRSEGSDDGDAGISRSGGRRHRVIRAVNRPSVAIVAVGILAAVLRFWNVGYPEHRTFDEYYYTKAACIYLGQSNATCDINSADERYWRTHEWDVGSWVHPPLGKYAIALGELAFGVNSFGWRVPSAVAGTAVVMMIAAIAWLLFASALWSFVAGLLLAVENLEFLLSRTGILDIFVTFWIVLGFLFILLDRRWMDRATPEAFRRPRRDDDESRGVFPAPLWRPWRFAAGVAFGAGVATKWSAATGIAAVVILAYVWEAERRKRAGLEHVWRRSVAAESFGLVLALVFVPIGVYLLSYLGWFIHFDWDLAHWWRSQVGAFTFQTHLRSSQEGNAYQSAAWKWLLLRRPVLFYRVDGPDFVQPIYANGNPAIFWGSLLAIPFAVFSWIRTKDWRAGFIVVTVLALYLPWFLSAHPEYLFYAAPISPFLVLACVYGLRAMTSWTITEDGRERVVRPLRPVAVFFVVVAVGLFVFFYPTLTAGTLSRHAYQMRVWFNTWQ